ncbi:MAG: DUF4476 domain-containing protein [Proteobacteria bacterium]|nr:DUF4476 domain-containing protein [Pseudomonadota bacterium]
MMKRFSQILLTSALALAVFAPVMASAAPKKCSLDDKEVVYVMMAIDRTVMEMQQDLLNNPDRGFQKYIIPVVNAVNDMHKDWGNRVVEQDKVAYSNELSRLKKAANDYYDLLYGYIDAALLPNAHKLKMLLDESEKAFAEQCKNPKNRNNNWKSQWSNARPPMPSHGGNPGMNAPHPNGHPGMNAPHPNGHPGGAPHPNMPVAPKPVVKTPVDASTFQAIQKQLDDCSFESDLIQMLDSIVPYNYFTMSQLQTLIKDQEFDDRRLRVMERVFPKVIDKNNWFVLYDLFSFQSSKDKVKKIAEANL